MNRLIYDLSSDSTETAETKEEVVEIKRAEHEEKEPVEINFPDFPPIAKNCALADLSLERFSEKTQQILDYLNSEQFAESIKLPNIMLPNMFFTELLTPSRFEGFTNRSLDSQTVHHSFEYIRMVNRSALVEKIKGKRHYMMYGPQGCGKSFVIIQLVAQLMREGHFVVFINNPNNLLADIFNILVAKLRSISPDNEIMVIDFENVFHNPKNTLERKSEIIWNFIGQAENEINSDENIFFVFDQLEQAKEHLGFLTHLFNSQFNCVFASTANNDQTKLEWKIERHGIDEDLVRFDDDQFRALCKLLGREFEEIERNQIMSITGAVVQQLYDFIKQVKATELKMKKEGKHIDSKEFLQTEIETYRNYMRENDYDKNNLEKYLQDISAKKESVKDKQNEKRKAAENVHYMICKYSSITSKTFDRRFLYLSPQKPYSDEDNLHPYRLKAISGLAFTQIAYVYINYFGEEMVNEMQAWFLKSMEKCQVRSIISSITEEYIIYELYIRSENELKNLKEIEFPVKVQGSSENGIVTDMKTEKLIMKNYSVVYFSGNLSAAPEFINSNMLYIPNNLNYPGYDFFYYENGSNTLYAVQITIEENVMNHVNRNDNSDAVIKALNDWLYNLPDGAQIFDIWLINRTDAFIQNNSERKANLNVVYFEDIESLPLLKTVEHKKLY